MEAPPWEEALIEAGIVKPYSNPNPILLGQGRMMLWRALGAWRIVHSYRIGKDRIEPIASLKMSSNNGRKGGREEGRKVAGNDCESN